MGHKVLKRHNSSNKMIQKEVKTLTKISRYCRSVHYLFIEIEEPYLILCVDELKHFVKIRKFAKNPYVPFNGI